ncbi:hypothetical protein STVA_07450 [Allostella vacuolata]|nr:hypothetical protein STVA_07450 [Stella vacuolata]
MTSPSPLEAAVEVARPWLREAPPDGADAPPLSRLADPGGLRPMIERHRRRFGPDACPRGAASVWSKHLFSALLPMPTLAALAGSSPPADPLVMVVDGLPKAVLADPPGALRESPAPDALADWTDRVLGDVAIAALVAASGLAPRLFWSNAAAMLAYLCEKWDAVPTLAGRAATLRAALFDRAALRGQIAYVATPVPEYPTLRRRRLCCLRDRLGQPLCSSCPRITAEARDAILRATAAKAAAAAVPTAPSTRPTG